MRKRTHVMTVEVLVLGLVATLGIGCKRSDITETPAPAAKTIAQEEHPVKDAAEIVLEKRDVEGLHLRWRFTNPHPFAVFVPDEWKDTLKKDWQRTPALLPVPPSDLLLAFGVFHISDEQLEGEPVTHYDLERMTTRTSRVGPGESIEGRLVIKFPLALRKDPCLRSPYLYPTAWDPDTEQLEAWLFSEDEVTRKELTTLWFAVNYSYLSPTDIRPEGKELRKTLRRRGITYFAIRGSRRDPDNPWWRPDDLAVSKPIQVRIPLEEPITLYYRSHAMPD